MTYRISFCGIDGGGKSSCISNLIDRLSPTYSVAEVGRPTCYREGDEEEYLFQRTTGFIDRMHSFFDSSRNRKGITLVNALNVILQSRIECIVGERKKPDVIITGRDMSICPSVYVSFYLPYSQKISTEKRLKFLDKIRKGGYPDLIIHIDLNPGTAVRRIDQRIEEEANGIQILNKEKWRHLHENFHDLTLLRGFYLEAIDILQKDGLKIVCIETNELSINEVVDRVEAEIALPS